MSARVKRLLGRRRIEAGCRSAVACLLLLTLAAAAAQAHTEAAGPRWIVELVDPPTLEFGGSDLATQSQGFGGVSADPFLEATAPAATGASRFDVREPAVQAYATYLDRRQADFVDAARLALGRALVAEGRTRHVANALIVSIDADEAEQLRQLPGVREVYQESLYSLQSNPGLSLIGAPALNQGSVGLPAARGEGVVIGIIDSGINWGHRAFSDNPAHTGGYVHQNPKGNQLGLCSRPDVPCNNKLIGVYDFTNEPNQGFDTDGHGTHVAAIAAGNPWQTGQSGVASRANIVSYRVCVERDPDEPDQGTCQGSAILQALDRAIADRVDVVNFSIGSTPSSPWNSATALRILNLREAGISFVTSAGNDGPTASSVGWPAEAPWALAVGATTTDFCAQGRVDIEGRGGRPALFGSGPNLGGPEIVDLPVRRATGFSNSPRACNPFPQGALQDAVLLVERGDCPFQAKVLNAQNAGARAVLVYNNEPDGQVCMAGLETTAIPSAMLSRSDGLELSGLTGPAGLARVSLDRRGLGDQLGSFSARGPSQSVPGIVKPNLVAPGVGIDAADMPNADSLAIRSGTSMSSPHVAGAIALLRQLDPTRSPSMLYSMLETTAETEPVTVGGNAATIFDRGAGRIRVDRAARAGLYLPVTRAQFLAANPAQGGSPGQLNLPSMVNTACDNGCSFTRTVRAIRSGSWTAQGVGPFPITVSPASFSLEAGQSQQLTIELRRGSATSGGLVEGRVRLRPAASSMSEQNLPVAAQFAAGGPEALIGGTADEPTGRLPLDVDPAQACPGFFVLRTHPGENSQPGRFGADIVVEGSGRRLLQGGLNFGGRATADIRGFAAFSISNPAREDQSLEIDLDAAGPGRLTLERRVDGTVELLFDQPVAAGVSQLSTVVPPGFYVIGFRPQQNQSTRFMISARTRFIDRPGGGFVGGAVIGGYNLPTLETTSFASFCLAEPRDARIKVLSSPTYGSSAARGKAFSLSDRDGNVLIDSRTSAP